MTKCTNFTRTNIESKKFWFYRCHCPCHNFKTGKVFESIRLWLCTVNMEMMDSESACSVCMDCSIDVKFALSLTV